MVQGRFISYLRVSTAQQGRSGLGLEAQRQAVADYLDGGAWTLVAEYTEVESGRHADRPQLAAAMAACRRHRATLVIAKLDRLARNARFLLDVVEGSGEGGVVFCDLPQVPPGPVGKFLVTQMAAVAELEAGLIGQRTKAALAAAKARGVTLGGARDGAADRARKVAEKGTAALQAKAAARAADLQPVLQELAAAGVTSQAGIARALAARGIPTPRGGRWSNVQVRDMQRRLEAGAVRQGI